MRPVVVPLPGSGAGADAPPLPDEAELDPEEPAAVPPAPVDEPDDDPPVLEPRADALWRFTAAAGPDAAVVEMPHTHQTCAGAGENPPKAVAGYPLKLFCGKTRLSWGPFTPGWPGTGVPNGT